MVRFASREIPVRVLDGHLHAAIFSFDRKPAPAAVFVRRPPLGPAVYVADLDRFVTEARRAGLEINLVC